MLFEVLQEITDSMEACSLGLHYHYLFSKYPALLNTSDNDFVLKEGEHNIRFIARKGEVDIYDRNNELVKSDFPENLVRDKQALQKLHSTQAFYIGYLSGEAFARKLRLKQGGMQ